MANKVKVATENVETQNETIATENVETQNEDTDILESDEQKAHREEVQSRTFVEGQFTVLVNLKHNGQQFTVGDSITLEADEAEKMKADGTI